MSRWRKWSLRKEVRNRRRPRSNCVATHVGHTSSGVAARAPQRIRVTRAETPLPICALAHVLFTVHVRDHYRVDVKGYSVDAKGYRVDVKPFHHSDGDVQVGKLPFRREQSPASPLTPDGAGGR